MKVANFALFHYVKFATLYPHPFDSDYKRGQSSWFKRCLDTNAQDGTPSRLTQVINRLKNKAPLPFRFR